MAVFRTGDFVLVDDTDQTKALNFDVSAGTTGNLRTVSFPHTGNATVAYQNVANTFTGGGQFNTSDITFADDIDKFFNFDSTKEGLTLHRAGAGSTADALRVENQVGALMTRINSSGHYVGGFGFTIADNSDATKKIAIFSSTGTTGTTLTLLSTTTVDRGVEFPDADCTLVGRSSSTALTAGRVPFASAASVLTDDTNLTYSASTGLSIQALNAVCYDDAVVCYEDAVVFY